LDAGGDENYTLQLQWTPTDNLEFNTRANERSLNRVFGAGSGGGLVVLSEEGLPTRNTTSAAFGFRQVDPTQSNFFASDFLNPQQEIFQFTNPATGQVVDAQRLRAGLDPAVGIGNGQPNQGFQNPNPTNECVFFDRDDIKGKDLCATTNGANFERFDHQSVTMDATWDLNDRSALKYIFGYTDYFYDRLTDQDLTASSQSDRSFYVIQETEYVSHEMQWSFTPSERMS